MSDLPKALVEAVAGACERLLRFPHTVKFPGSEDARNCARCPFPACNCRPIGYFDCWNAALAATTEWPIPAKPPLIANPPPTPPFSLRIQTMPNPSQAAAPGDE